MGYGAIKLGEVGERVEDQAGSLEFVLEVWGVDQDRQRAFQRIEAVVGGTGMAVDAVEEGGEIDELVVCFDELKIKEILFTQHGVEFDGSQALVNGEEKDRGLRGVSRWCEVRGCSRPMCMI